MALARLQFAAFSHAQARPGLSTPETVPVKVLSGETLEAAVRRAGVAPEEARAAVSLLGQAMDTVHIKAGMLIQAAIAMPRRACDTCAVVQPGAGAAGWP